MIVRPVERSTSRSLYDDSLTVFLFDHPFDLKASLSDTVAFHGHRSSGRNFCFVCALGNWVRLLLSSLDHERVVPHVFDGANEVVFQSWLNQTLRMGCIVDVVEGYEFAARNDSGDKLGSISNDRLLRSMFRFVPFFKQVVKGPASRLGKIHSFSEAHNVLGDPFL